MELPKPMTWRECAQEWPCSGGGEGEGFECRSEKLVALQHRRDMAWFVALLRGEAKRQAGEGSYTDVWRDDWALSYEFLADELEAVLKEG